MVDVRVEQGAENDSQQARLRARRDTVLLKRNLKQDFDRLYEEQHSNNDRAGGNVLTESALFAFGRHRMIVRAEAKMSMLG